MLLSYGTIMLLQLLPLPLPIWTRLPGHAPFAMLAQAEPGWRAASISPDRTLNSVASLCVPLAALLLTQRLAPSKRGVLVALVAGGLASGCVAAMQLALGPGNAFYLYRLTASGAVGLFANSNHQAVMLACMLPVVALWLAQSPRSNLRYDGVAASTACLLLVLIVITGSRSGLAAALVGLLAAFALHHAQLADPRADIRLRYRLFYLAFCVVAVVLVVAMTLLGRDLAVKRALDLSVSSDLRVSDFGLFVDLARSYFPVGSGAGTFDPAFRMIEPAAVVKSTFVNHAHNELVELVITCGLPGVLLLLLFFWWYAAAMFRVVRAPRRERDGYALLGGCVIAIMLLASLSDYPLRTPTMAAFFALACAWLSMGSIAVKSGYQVRAAGPDGGRISPKFQDDLAL